MIERMLGPYQVLSTLGVGGMGEVYKARDTRLDRLVAIKVLPEALADDATFRDRFTREAKSLSTLNHPHICALYDVGEAQAPGRGPQAQEAAGRPSVHYLVLEYLEGETLADRLARQRFAVDEALELAIQVADALDAAHHAGLVHRDLKPANIFLCARGGRAAAGASQAGGVSGLNVKLLDFGLAKPAAPAIAGAGESVLPTRSQPLTAEGTILGTFQYMAPEQLEGREADARTDLFAFGAVLYEVLTGRKAFEGPSHASLIGAIMHAEPPPVATMQPLTPPALDRVVRTCLAKHPDDRFQTAHDVALQLKWIRDGGSAAGLPAPVVAARRHREWFLFAVAALAVGLLGAAAAWILKPAPAAPPHVVTRFTNLLPAGQRFTRSGRRVLDISPDGTTIVYVANARLYVRHLDDETPVAITGDVDPLSPTFSPDGTAVAYVTAASGGGNASLWRVPVAGGTPTRLCEISGHYGLSWARGRIVWADSLGIHAVDDNGGAAATLVSADRSRGETLSHPQLLADGALVFTDTTGETHAGGTSRVVVLDPGATKRRVLASDGADGRVTPAGYLVFYRDSTLFAATFDRATRTVRGSLVPIVRNVGSAPATGGGQYAVSSTGTLVFRGRGSATLALVWVDRYGTVEPIPGAPLRDYGSVRLSPDGTRIATATAGDSSEIFIWDTKRSVEAQVTTDAAIHKGPVWLPGGQELLFAAIQGDTSTWFRRRVDLATPARLVRKFQMVALPLDVSTDGTTVLLDVLSPGAPMYLARLSLADANSQPIPLTGTDVGQMSGTLSPDGRWVAFRAGGSVGQIFVRPFPDATAGRTQVSQNGGIWPAWSPTGRELFYFAGNPGSAKLMLTAAAVTTSPTLEIGTPQPLFDGTPLWNGTDIADVGYDVAPGGQRFVMLAQPAGSDERSYTVVTHWFDELQTKVK
jgi:eukaryotic-like serine/threonine-protein kinase